MNDDSGLPCRECEFQPDPHTCLEVGCPFSEEREFKGHANTSKYS